MKPAFIATFAIALLAACGKKSDPAPHRPPDDAPMPGDCRTEADCEAVIERECGASCPRVVAKKKNAPKVAHDCEPSAAASDAHELFSHS